VTHYPCSETALKEAITNAATDRIDEFTREFVQLKSMLDTGIGLQVAFVSSRVLENVESICMFVFALTVLTNDLR
jgi:hypothetical protein